MNLKISVKRFVQLGTGEMSYLWLRGGRRLWSKLLNFCFRKERQALPEIHDLEGVKHTLALVRWSPDTHGDWVQAQELTCGRKKGDCEDCAALAMALLKQTGGEGYLLSVILSPAEYSHAVCIFSSGETFNYFSNGLMKKSELRYIEDIVRSIANGHQLICWSMEDREGKIIQIKRGN